LRKGRLRNPCFAAANAGKPPKPSVVALRRYPRWRHNCPCGRRCWSLLWEVFVVWFRFRVSVSWRLRSEGPLSRPAVFSWECASRREAARLLWRLRAARRWWWSVPRLGSAGWCRLAAEGRLPSRGSLRWLWAPRVLLGGVVRVSVSVVGCPFAVRVFCVPRARRRPRLLC